MAFDANQVPINYTLSFGQVNLILRALGKLPMEEVEQFYVAFRSVAVQTLQQAEQAAKDAERQAELPVAEADTPKEEAA